jgi:hypothetical protein
MALFLFDYVQQAERQMRNAKADNYMPLPNEHRPSSFDLIQLVLYLCRFGQRRQNRYEERPIDPLSLSSRVVVLVAAPRSMPSLGNPCATTDA